MLKRRRPFKNNCSIRKAIERSSFYRYAPNKHIRPIGSCYAFQGLLQLGNSIADCEKRVKKSLILMANALLHDTSNVYVNCSRP